MGDLTRECMCGVPVPFIIYVDYEHMHFKYSIIVTRTIVRVIKMFQNAHYKKPIFQELVSRVLL